jgi:hypothetical protein
MPGVGNELLLALTNGSHVIVGPLATTDSLVPTPDGSTIASSARCQQLSEQKFMDKPKTV